MLPRPLRADRATLPSNDLAKQLLPKHHAAARHRSGRSRNNNVNRVVTVVTPSPAFPAFPLTTTASSSERLNYLGTVRGRAGWLASPSLLIYGTGGLAYGEVRQAGLLTQTIAPPDPSVPVPGVGANTTTRAGYVVGAGAEWMAPGSRWSVKFEAI